MLPIILIGKYTIKNKMTVESPAILTVPAETMRNSRL